MILGAVAGDVIGSVYEFNNVKREDFVLFTKGTTFTDDSVMTLAVAEAIMDASADKRLEDALVASMQRLGRAYPDAGYGARFGAWIRSAAPRPYNSWGNGSAMRVSPAAWAADSVEDAERLAERTAVVTHNHPEGVKGAQATAACIAMARDGAADDAIRAYVEGRFGYDLDFTLDEIRARYSFDVSCQGSVPQAIVAFLEADSFEGAVRKAISIGGDSDTIAAIAASIAQARYGVPPAIEQEVRTRLPTELLAVNDRFCAAYGVS